MRKFIYLLTLLSATLPAVGQTFEDYVARGSEAFVNYDFDQAERDFGMARKKFKKIPTEKLEYLDSLEAKLDIGRNFMSRVERLQIIDSIAVPRDYFFKAYKLPTSAGKLADASSLPRPVDDVDYVFTNEQGDFKMWAEPDSTGYYRIAESSRLTDGSWSETQYAPDDLADGGDALYPFMMADGVTLYFAADGESSLGGLDIFIATRDATTGEYMQPQNIGMPYNSPYDDYMLAIDELNGVGWWATDRNQLDDKITIYLYRLNDLRSNYDADDEDIVSWARIDDYKATQDPDFDYAELKREINSIKPEIAKKIDFRFPMGGGTMYTTLSDFKTKEGREAMKKFLAAEKKYNSDLETLNRLRRQYAANPKGSVTTDILKLESDTAQAKEELKTLRNAIYKAEYK